MSNTISAILPVAGLILCAVLAFKVAAKLLKLIFSALVLACAVWALTYLGIF